MAAAKFIPLTAARLRELLSYDPESGVFTWRATRGALKAGATAGSVTDKGYISIYISGRNYRAHRLAWLYMKAVEPADEIDHRDRNKTNNRFSNLREATNKQNHENMGLQRNNTSGIRGVYWYKPSGKWMAMIQHNSRQIFLGYFDDIVQAATARRAAERQYFTHLEPSAER